MTVYSLKTSCTLPCAFFRNAFCCDQINVNIYVGTVFAQGCNGRKKTQLIKV